MGRIRTVKPDLYAHELLNELEEKHPFLRPTATFSGLFTQSDKKGRFEWKPRSLKLAILPFVDSHSMADALDLLEGHGFIKRYEVGGKSYGLIPTWNEHQRITGKEAILPARYPDPLPEGNTGEGPSVSPGNIKHPEKPTKGRKASPKKPEDEALALKLPPEQEAWFEAIWFDVWDHSRWGRKQLGRKNFGKLCRKFKPVALYLAARGYFKKDEKVRDGFIQEVSTFFGPGKSTYADYLESVFPFLELHPTLAALKAPPQSEEHFWLLVKRDDPAPAEAAHA